MNTSSIPAMNRSATLSSKNRTERAVIRERCRDLVGEHRVPIRELISERFLVSIECTLGPAFFDRLSKIDKEDLIALDDLASQFTSLPNFRELINAATADWVIGKLKERGVRSHRNHIAVKASAPAQPPQAEFALPDSLQAITEEEFRTLFGPRRLISPTDLAKLIQEGRAYEETLEPTGGHVVVIYIRTDEGDVHTLLVEGEHYFKRLRYFLPIRQAAQVYFFTLDIDPNDVERAKATLAEPDKFRTTVRIADAILRVEEDPTRIIDLIREFVDANVPGEGRELANAILDFIAEIPPEHASLIVEFLQFMLDIVGLLPGLGEPVDAINTAISLRQEQYLDAGLSAASMVPVVGAIPGAGKALRRISTIIRFADTLPAGIRGVLLDLLGGLKDELASLASRKMSDIVNGLKRRVNEAADRLRLAVKKKDDASLPGSGAKKAVSPTSKTDAEVVAKPPTKPPLKQVPENERPSKKPRDEDTSTRGPEASEGDPSSEKISTNKINQMLREEVGPPPMNSVRTANPTVTWVDEAVSMSDEARLYNSGAQGARSNVVTRQPQAPSIPRTVNGQVSSVRFDGEAPGLLIDRKLAVVTSPKAQNQALRQAEALRQNGLRGVWEVPDATQAARARGIFTKLGIDNIDVRVAP